MGPHCLHINHGCPSPLCLPHSFCQRSCATRNRDGSSFHPPPRLHSGAGATGQTSKWNMCPRDVSFEKPQWSAAVEVSHAGAGLCRTVQAHAAVHEGGTTAGAQTALLTFDTSKANVLIKTLICLFPPLYICFSDFLSLNAKLYSKYEPHMTCQMKLFLSVLIQFICII